MSILSDFLPPKCTRWINNNDCLSWQYNYQLRTFSYWAISNIAAVCFVDRYLTDINGDKMVGYESKN
jgi:hypothetical protein